MHEFVNECMHVCHERESDMQALMMGRLHRSWAQVDAAVSLVKHWCHASAPLHLSLPESAASAIQKTLRKLLPVDARQAA